MEQRTWSYMGRHAMTRPADRVLAAVSGGADSVALLALLRVLAPRLGVTLHVAHVNHGLRETAGRDEEHVARLCADWGLKLTVVREDVPALMARWGQSAEVAARNARWAALRRVAGEQSCRVIATAHHRGDQAETVLLRLTRGAGAPGAAAMAPVGDGIIRPLLWASHGELTDYLTSRSIPWCEDETNDDLTQPRNLIRHRVMPLLNTLNPAADRALCRTAALMARDEDFFRPPVRELTANIRRVEDGLALPLGAADGVHPAVLSRALRVLAAQMGCRDLPAACVEAGLALTQGARARAVHWPDGLTLRRGDGALLLTRGSPPPPPEPVPLRIPGETELPGLGVFMCSLLPRAPAPLPEGDAQCFDWAAFPKGVVARTRRDGDRIHPLGAPGSRKLQDVFTDRKICRWQRDGVPLIAVGSRVLWAVGVARDEDTRIADPRRPVVLITHHTADAPGEEETDDDLHA